MKIASTLNEVLSKQEIKASIKDLLKFTKDEPDWLIDPWDDVEMSGRPIEDADGYRDVSDYEIDSIKMKSFMVAIHDVVLDILNRSPSEDELKEVAKAFAKDIKGSKLSFKKFDKKEDLDIEFFIKVKQAKYDPKKDIFTIDKFDIEDRQI